MLVPRALIVDDDDAVLRVHARVLSSAGYDVTTASSGRDAVAALDRATFDVVLSDIDMPGMSGLDLLGRVREHDLDVPVVLITGSPSIDTAVRAIEHGALRYLVKPVNVALLQKTAADAVRLHELARAKRHALDHAGGVDRLLGDHASLEAALGRALDSLYVAYQPIVSWHDRRVFAYEALLRSREPSLPNPRAVLDAAARLGKLHELGRRIRAKVVEPLAALEGGELLFLNLHPEDLLDDEMVSPSSPLSAVAGRVVLEITDRASLHGVRDVQGRVAALRALGYRIAVDNLGAGYAGLSSFALLEPEIVKIDIDLVRDIDRDPTKQTLVRTILAMCKELGIATTAEGIETAGERDELVRAGCDLMQGYLFARPASPLSSPIC